MPLGPKDLQKPNDLDKQMLAEFERIIDESPEFQRFRGGIAKVELHPAQIHGMFGPNRGDIRKTAFIKHYQNAGWVSVIIEKDGIVFSDVDPSAGRE